MLTNSNSNSNLNSNSNSNSIFKNNDFNLEEDLHSGQIYLIKNKINSKCYIGQALCFTGSNNNRWGTIGRWKSHVREATRTNQDHCVLLNNAIRKYGQDNFDVSTLVKCNKNDLDEWEVKYVSEYNSVKPNGYNIKFGGYGSKNNESTIQKMKEAHKGKEHSEETKQKIGLNQIGNRRNAMKRKNEEDNDLPKYILCRREKKIIKGYIIECFPIGINKVEYLKNVSFSISKYGSKELSLKAAIEYLNELKEKYKYIDEEVKILKEETTKKSIKEIKENILKDKLPEYIYPIIEDNKINGYYVDNFLNKNGKKYPKREFKELTNRYNLSHAKKFIEMLKYINENNVDLKIFDTDNLDVNDIEKAFYEKYYLPMYFNVLRRKGEIIGFCINGYPCDKFKDGKYKKEFRLKSRSLDETYEEGIEELNDLKNGYIEIKLRNK
jgi:group I intron endonuclease